MQIIGNSHLVCFNCRRSRKQAKHQCISQMCAECGSPMYDLGKLFMAPRRRDDAEWLKIELMVANGWDGHNWPVKPEMSLREVKDTLHAWDESRMALYRATKIQSGIERRRKLARVRSRKTKTALKQQRLEVERQRLYQEQILSQVSCVISKAN